MSPDVSVIIPTFNREKFVCRAIDSVLVQDYKGFELIVIDDGSVDNTPSLLARYGDRVKILTQKNLGVSAARNSGIKKASGEFIAFLDSDDTWLPSKLSTQVKFFNENPGVSICQTEEIWIRNNVRVNPRLVHKKHSGWIFNFCLKLCIVSPSAVMLKKQVFDSVGLFDESLPACEDYDFWLRVALKFEIHTLDEKLIVKHGGHLDQLSRQWGLDRYRIVALKNILGSPLLSGSQKKLVQGEIDRRANIVIKGARKRGQVLRF